MPSSSTVSVTSPFASDRSVATTGATAALAALGRRAGLDRRPAERRHLDLGQDLATVRGENEQLPERIGGCRGGRHDLADEFVDIELGRLADIVDQQRDRRDLGLEVDVRAVQLAPEQLAAMPPPPEELREPVAAQPQPGDHRVPARELLGRDRRPASARTPARQSTGTEASNVTRSVRVVGDGLTTAQLPSGTAAAIRCPVSLRMPRPSLFRLCVAGQDLGDHDVVRAATDRIVGRVVDDPPPGELEQALGPRSAVQRGQRLGIALEQAFDATGGGRRSIRAELTPISMFARAPERSSPVQRGNGRSSGSGAPRSRPASRAGPRCRRCGR